MSSFRIKAIKALTFGRFNNASIDNFDHSFVVVHGANESGKSTLTEFLTWMIGGPVGSATESQRFGEPEQTLTGRLIADINGQPADIGGKFKIKKSGTPNDDRSGTIGPVTVTAREIGAQVGHLQAADYAFIYRLIGPVLHDTESAENFAGILSQFAIGSAVSDVNPSTVADDLFKKAKSRKSEADSVKKEIKKIEQRILEQQKSPARLTEIEKELAEIENRIAGIEASDVERAKEMERYNFAISAFESNSKVHSLREQIESLVKPSEDWVEAVKNVSDIRRELESVKALRESIQAARVEAETSAAQVGSSVETLAVRSFSLNDKSQVQMAGDALRDATNDVATSQHQCDDGNDVCRRASERLEQAAAHLNITSEAARSLPAVIGTWTELNNAAITWRNNETRVRQQQDLARKAVEELEAAQAHLKIQEDHHGSDAGVSTRNDVVVMAGVAIVGLVAGFFWKPALLIGAALVGTLFVRAKRGSQKVASPSSPDALAEARNRVRELEGKSVDARKLAGELRIDADTARDEFVGLLASFGVDIPSVELAQDVCSRIKEASDAATALQSEESQQQSRVASHDEVVAAMNRAQHQFDAVTSAHGFTYSGALSNLSSWLDTYSLAVTQSQKLVESHADLEKKESLLRTLFGSAISVDTDLHAERLVEELEHHVEVSTAYHDITEQLAQAERDARVASGNSEEVQEILLSVTTKAELQSHRDALDEVRKEGRKERDKLVETRQSLTTEKDDIEKTEFINELNLQKSALEERLEEVTSEMEVFTIAAKTLADVINEFQLKNQGPLVTRANRILDAVVPGYGDLVYFNDESGKPVIERVSDSDRLRTSKLSTGSRALAYLALRLAFIEADHAKRGVALPVLCDDPLVHVDDKRAPEVIKILAQASSSRQVVLFTCHEDTRDLAVAAGAHVVTLA